jgi:hypothetical protein
MAFPVGSPAASSKPVGSKRALRPAGRGQALHGSDAHKGKGQKKREMWSKALLATPGKACRAQRKQRCDRQGSEQGGTVHGPPRRLGRQQEAEQAGQRLPS